MFRNIALYFQVSSKNEFRKQGELNMQINN